jgi:hypothetical protein
MVGVLRSMQSGDSTRVFHQDLFQFFEVGSCMLKGFQAVKTGSPINNLYMLYFDKRAPRFSTRQNKKDEADNEDDGEEGEEDDEEKVKNCKMCNGTGSAIVKKKRGAPRGGRVAKRARKCTHQRSSDDALYSSEEHHTPIIEPQRPDPTVVDLTTQEEDDGCKGKESEKSNDDDSSQDEDQDSDDSE